MLHFNRLGRGHENFADKWPSGDASSVQAFATKESTGRIIGTKSSSINRLTAGKKIHGLMVDMWAKDWAEGLICKAEVKEYCNDVDGMFEEVEKIKWLKYA